MPLEGTPLKIAGGIGNKGRQIPPYKGMLHFASKRGFIVLLVATCAHAQFIAAPGSPAAVGTSPQSAAAGDFNGDNIINSLEYSLINRLFGQAAPANSIYDLTRNGSINSQDLNLLVGNYLKTGE